MKEKRRTERKKNTGTESRRRDFGRQASDWRESGRQESDWRESGGQESDWRESRRTEPHPRHSNQQEPQSRESDDPPSRIIGRNPVTEALKSGRPMEKLVLLRDGEGSLIKIEGMAKELRIPIQYADRRSLSRMAEGENHQGVIAITVPYRYWELDELICHAQKQEEAPFLILLDGIEDPHNLGAILRTADGAGAHGVIIPKRRAAGLTETAVKSSAGAAEYVPVARVPNLGQAIDQLKEAGLWICACDMDGELYDQAELSGGIGLVIGGEGRGVGRLIREKCDFILSIPMCGKLNSLNASNAAAVLMYEMRRQRRRQADKTKG